MARVALITGASRGIGLATARRLAGAGWAVGLVARGADALEAARGEVEALGVPAAAVAADLRDPEAPARAVATVEERLGSLELVVGNAGTAPAAPLERTTDAMLDEVLDLHVRAPLRFARAVVPAMRERGAGTLIHVASTAGLRGYPRTTAYTAAKHGLVGLTRALAAELRDDPVRVLAVCPGFVDTDITRGAAAAVAARTDKAAEDVLASLGATNACGRLLQPDEVAAAVLDLIRDPELRSGTLCVLDDVPPIFLPPDPP